MLAPVNLEVEAPHPQSVGDSPVAPMLETTLKIAIDVAEVVDDVADELAVDGLRVGIEYFSIDHATSKVASSEPAASVITLKVADCEHIAFRIAARD